MILQYLENNNCPFTTFNTNYNEQQKILSLRKKKKKKNVLNYTNFESVPKIDFCTTEFCINTEHLPLIDLQKAFFSSLHNRNCLMTMITDSSN